VSVHRTQIHSACGAGSDISQRRGPWPEAMALSSLGAAKVCGWLARIHACDGRSISDGVAPATSSAGESAEAHFFPGAIRHLEEPRSRLRSSGGPRPAISGSGYQVQADCPAGCKKPGAAERSSDPLAVLAPAGALWRSRTRPLPPGHRAGDPCQLPVRRSAGVPDQNGLPSLHRGGSTPCFHSWRATRSKR